MVVPIGHLSDRRGARGIMVACALTGTVTYGLIVGVAGMPLWLYAVLLFVSGGAIGSTNPIALAIGQRLAPASASIISGILMGLAWAVASLSVALTGALASLQPIGVLATLTGLGGLGILGTIAALFVRD